MSKFDIRRTSRKCSANGRAFVPGEEFYSALVETEDGALERDDYSNEQWKGEPEDCLGWWKAKMPDTTTGRVYWAPAKVLLAYFQHVLDQPECADVAYVMSIVLIRNRSLKMIDTDDQVDPPVMTCRHNATNTNYNIPVVDVAPDRIAAIQEELEEQLFTGISESSLPETDVQENTDD